MDKTNLLVFLHGVGGNGKDMASLGAYFQQTLPQLRYEAPDAPHAMPYMADAYQWFDLNGITPTNRLARIEAARPDFDAVLQSLLAKHGLSGDLDHVVLCGFSQGTIMALDALASGRWPVRAVIGFSGRLATPVGANISTNTVVLLQHGEADHVIDVDESTQAAQRLSDAGLAVTLHTYAGLGHGISQTEAAVARDFLQQHLR